MAVPVTAVVAAVFSAGLSILIAGRVTEAIATGSAASAILFAVGLILALLTVQVTAERFAVERARLGRFATQVFAVPVAAVTSVTVFGARFRVLESTAEWGGESVAPAVAATAATIF
jgi:hypothetical protein